MTIRNVIKALKHSGYDVSFYIRKDGGVRITKINGESFRGSSGNIRGREIIGAKLSEARARQLSKLKTPKGKGSYNKRRRKKLDENVIKRIQKLQRKYRKEKTKGQPTISNYRWVMEHFGKEEADRLLKQSDLYIRGIAYTENIDALVDRLRSDADKISKEEKDLVQEIIDKLNSMKGILRESVLGDILEEKSPLYRWEKGEIETRDMHDWMMKKLETN